jgi:hypothetical protein
MTKTKTKNKKETITQKQYNKIVEEFGEDPTFYYGKGSPLYTPVMRRGREVYLLKNPSENCKCASGSWLDALEKVAKKHNISYATGNSYLCLTCDTEFLTKPKEGDN